MVEQKYKAILTPFGHRAILHALSTGETIKLSYMGIGDGGEKGEYTPEEGQEKLFGEWYETDLTLNNLFIDPKNPYYIIAEGVIPADIPSDFGRHVREIALKDENKNVVTVASVPESYKPTLDEGAAKAMVVRSTLEVSNTDVFVLKIDTSLVWVTKDEFDRHTQQTTGVHGSTVQPLPNTIVERDGHGNVKTSTPREPDDAARLTEIRDVITLIGQREDSGIPIRVRHTGDGVTTRFNMMGLETTNPDAILVSFDGVGPQPSNIYTVDLGGSVSQVVFNTPPPLGVEIEMLTVAVIQQIPEATPVVPGIVKLATHMDLSDIMDSGNDTVVTAKSLRESRFDIKGLGNNPWRISISSRASIMVSDTSCIDLYGNSRIVLEGETRLTSARSGNGAVSGLNGSFKDPFISVPTIGTNFIELNGNSRLFRIAGLTRTVRINAQTTLYGESNINIGDIFYFIPLSTTITMEYAPMGSLPESVETHPLTANRILALMVTDMMRISNIPTLSFQRIV